MVLTKRHLAIGGVLVLVLLSALVEFLVSERSVVASAATRELPIYCVESEQPRVALTFDAAWGAEDTQILIDELAKYGAKATFFVVGEWVDKYPDAVRSLHVAGHSVMNHSDTHPHMTQLSKEGILKEANLACDKIERITGIRTDLLRVPYGDYNDTVVKTLREGGYQVIQWDVDSLDWKDLSANEIYDRVTEKVKSGSIVLFHNAAKHTPEALPMILEDLSQKGYEFVTVGDLILQENYYIDHTGKQISTADKNGMNGEQGRG